jgi:DNA-binding NtrC family response regulator
MNISMSQPNTILVVDDVEGLRKSACLILQCMGDFDVIEAKDGIIAWTLLDTNRQIAGVFSDFQMGTEAQDGLTLWGKVCKQFPHLPFMMVTGNLEALRTESVNRNIALPTCLEKPYCAQRVIRFFKENIKEKQ